MKKISGFSMMEMMIVILIMVIIAAALAPIVSQKLLSNTGNKEDHCHWQAENFNKRLHFASQSLREGHAHKARQVSIGRIEAPNEFKVKFHVSADDRGQISIGDETQQLVASAKSKETINNWEAEDSFYFNSKNYDENIGQHNTVIGINTDNNKKSNNTLLGNGIKSLSNYTTIVGTNIEPLVDSSVSAMGTNIQLGRQAIAIGSTEDVIKATGEQSIAIGTSVYKKGNTSRDKTKDSSLSSEGKKSIAIGAGAVADKTNSIAIGSSNYYITEDNYHYNPATKSSGERSIAIGSGCIATGEDSIAIGNRFKDYSDSWDPEALPGYSSNIEYGNAPIKASGKGSIALGQSSIAGAKNTIAIGRFARAAVGKNAYFDFQSDTFPVISSYWNAMAIGYMSRASNRNAVAIGPYARATEKDQIVLGNKNSTVYIPGRLIVDYGTILGAKGEADEKGRTLININDGDGHRYAIMGSHNGNFVFSQKDIYFVNEWISKYYQQSDSRLKNVGTEYKFGLEHIKKIKTFNYTFKKDPNKTPRVGVIAQDLQKIFPQTVMKGEDGFLRIRMEDMFYAVINAVKELDAKITALNNTEIKQLHNRVAVLKKQNKELLKQRKKLEKRLNRLERKV